jgi:hypothetical protein
LTLIFAVEIQSLQAEFPKHRIRELVRLEQGTQGGCQGKIAPIAGRTLGRNSTRDQSRVTPALVPVADIEPSTANVLFVPIADAEYILPWQNLNQRHIGQWMPV